MNTQAHIEYLAKANGIRILDEPEAQWHTLMEALATNNPVRLMVCNSFSAENAKTGERVMWIDTDESDDPLILYFVGLHEIGHQALGHRNAIEDLATVVENEIAAWEWALEHSMQEPTDEVYLMIIDALSTYTDKQEGKY
jgi:hypothetical protein